MNSRQIWNEQLFDAVKMQDVITMYSHRVDKSSGRTRCPFHDGHDDNLSYTPDVFQCWVCGTKGNIISFVAQLFGTSSREAAKKIDADFRLGIFGKKPTLSARRKAERRLKERKQRQAELDWLNVRYSQTCDIRRGVYRSLLWARDRNLAELATEANKTLAMLDEELDELMEKINAGR